MKFNGTIVLALPEVSGTSQSGKSWRRRSYVCRYDATNEKYPKEVLFDVMGDRIDELNIQQGGQYELEVDFTVREWNGKRFMQASAWKAVRLDASPTPPAQVVTAAAAPAPAPAPDNGDQLPF